MINTKSSTFFSKSPISESKMSVKKNDINENNKSNNLPLLMPKKTLDKGCGQTIIKYPIRFKNSFKEKKRNFKNNELNCFINSNKIYGTYSKLKNKQLINLSFLKKSGIVIMDENDVKKNRNDIRDIFKIKENSRNNNCDMSFNDKISKSYSYCNIVSPELYIPKNKSQKKSSSFFSNSIFLKKYNIHEKHKKITFTSKKEYDLSKHLNKMLSNKLNLDDKGNNLNVSKDKFTKKINENKLFKSISKRHSRNNFREHNNGIINLDFNKSDKTIQQNNKYIKKFKTINNSKDGFLVDSNLAKTKNNFYLYNNKEKFGKVTISKNLKDLYSINSNPHRTLDREPFFKKIKHGYHLSDCLINKVKSCNNSIYSSQNLPMYSLYSFIIKKNLQLYG